MTSALAPGAERSATVTGAVFTSSTSFANPAVTFARMFSDTCAGIAPSSVPGFIAFQLVGSAIAVGAIRVLYPDAPRVASRAVVRHDADAVEHPEPSRDRR